MSKNALGDYMRGMTKTKVQELQKKAERYDDLKEAEMIDPFSKQFMQNLGVMAAYNRMDKWPDWFHTAFKAAAKEYPLLARMYEERHIRIIRY